jgi:transposase
MFTRIKKFKNKDGSIREYLFIVENKWVNGKAKQNVIANLGRLDKAMTGRVDSLMESVSKYASRQNLINACKDIEPLNSKTYGELIIFRKIWHRLGLDKLFKKYLKESNKEIDLTEAIFALVSNRLIAPSSKREACYWKEEVYEPKWDNYQLHHFYRALDFIQKNKEKMEKELFDTTKDIFKCKVDVMMFDTTTVKYWGKGKDNDLLDYGYSKEKRGDLKQLVLGIIMDKDGVPLGHEVWPGNTSDKKSFKKVIDKIKYKYSIEKVILVCDRGMISEKIIEYLEAEKYEYILGVRMRQLSKDRRNILLSEKLFKRVSKNISVKELKEWELYEQSRREAERQREASGKEVRHRLNSEELKEYKKSKKGRRRWVVYLNEKVASQDREKREYFKKIIENKIEFRTAKEWIVKNGYKKYVTIKEMSIELDRDKLQEEWLYDGKWALISNSKLDSMELVYTYKDLNQIERHFRSLKSDIEVGPIFHWTESRIRAHIFVCFLALQIKVALTKAIKSISKDLSYSEVMRDVRKIKAVTFRVKDLDLTMRTDLSGKAHSRLRHFWSFSRVIN